MTSSLTIWGALQQLFYCCRHFRDVEHLKVVLQTCWPQIGKDVIDRTIGQIRKQPMEDTLSTALTNVLGATRTLSFTRCVIEIQNLGNYSK